MSAAITDQNKRRAQRHRTLKGAHVLNANGTSTISCTVRNLSETGALLAMATTTGIPDTFRLMFDADRAKRNCRVAWRDARQMGVEFLGDDAVIDDGPRRTAAFPARVADWEGGEDTPKALQPARPMPRKDPFSGAA